MSSNGSPLRVAVIGLDGATWDLLSPWIDAGLLPNLARVRAQSLWGPLRSTIPPVTAPAWVTFQTGVNPEKHGFFDFTRYQPGSYATPLLSARDIPLPTLWQLVGDAGRRVIAINVPITYPPPEVNGVIVSGMLAPSTTVQYTYPAAVAEELRQVVGDYPIFTPIRTVETLGVHAFIDRLIDSIKRRTVAALHLLANHPWDLFMVHFQSTDVIQHALYSHLSPAHPAYDSVPAEERQAALGFYRALDEELGKILAALGTGVATVLMSDHGFGPLTRRIYLNRLLVQAGMLTVHRGETGLRAVAAAEAVVRKLDVFKLRRRLLPAFSARDQAARQAMSIAQIDWSRTRAFALAGAVYGRVHLNLAGREENGIVPAASRERVIDEVIHGLSSACDPLNGQPLFARILRREEAYARGPRSEHLPDLVLIPSDGYMITEAFRGDQLVEASPDMLTGNHRQEGIFSLAGPGIPGGDRVEGVRIVDLAPTILHLLGVPVPTWMDGRVLTAAASLRAPGVGTDSLHSSLHASSSYEDVYSTEDQRIIEERLRGLGYME